MSLTDRDKAIDRARFIHKMASEVDPNDIRAGLMALATVGVNEALVEKYRIDNEHERARQAASQGDAPEGWCMWCSSGTAAVWVEVEQRMRGVCRDCYADLNRGR